jgi:hypothetical protein
MNGMKRTFVLFLICMFLFACKKAPGPQTQEGNPESPAANPAAPLPKTVAPDTYYQFELERLRAEKEAEARYLSIFKAADSYDSKLEPLISKAERDTALSLKAIRDKYQVSFQDIARANQDPGVRRALEAYLDGHPEIKREMDDLESAKLKMDGQINAELERLAPKETETPAQKSLLPGAGK